MAITPSQMSDWTAQGPTGVMAKTYDLIASALRASDALEGQDFEVFLQGSYGNATNTRGDSDVDVVVMLKSTFYPDVSQLTSAERETHERRRIPGTETPQTFRQRVEEALIETFGRTRVVGKNKCLYVPKSAGYVDADVVPALQVRKYLSYPTSGEPTFIEGIRITPLDGAQIENFPKRHRDNGVAKHQETNLTYKPTVRQVKRLRRLAVDQGLVRVDAAPGYLLECMTYNAPSRLFVADDAQRLCAVVNWLASHTAEQLADTFWSADRVHKLFRNDPGMHNEYTAEKVAAALSRMLQ